MIFTVLLCSLQYLCVFPCYIFVIFLPSFHSQNNMDHGSTGFCIDDPLSLFWIGVWVKVWILFFKLNQKWLFWAIFLCFVPGNFLELTPLSNVLFCLLITLIFLWHGLVISRFDLLSLSLVLWVRVSFSMLLSWHICKHKHLVTLLLQFLLDFEWILIRNS